MPFANWGDLCGSQDVAAAWADRLIGIARLALSPDSTVRGYYCGTSACLSALYRAERYQEIVELLDRDDIGWPYRRWAVKALGTLGRTSEAIQYAESCRGPWTSDYDVDRVCEDILLLSGLVEDAYRYGLRANRAGTYLETFRAVARKHPHKTASEILHDLVRTMPGDEGKWFAAAKEAGLYDEALALASASACDPRTLTRAARELAISQSRPDGMAMWIDEIIGSQAGDFVRRNPLLVEDVRTRMLAGIAAIRTPPPPQPIEHWAVSERFRGIEHAGLVVVNIRDETERVAAELLIADVQRLRKDDALFRDILGWRGHRTPITAVVANIADPSESGRKKALRRVRRTPRMPSR
jgi:hypothetical protein